MVAMRLYPPLLGLILLALAWLLNSIFPSVRLLDAVFQWLGLALGAIGIVLFVWALSEFKKHETPVRISEKPTALVTSGPLAFSRNPIYLGFCLVLLGIAVWMGTIFYFLVPVVFFLIINAVQIPKEEKMLHEIFGEQYIEYKKRVRRWL